MEYGLQGGLGIWEKERFYQRKEEITWISKIPPTYVSGGKRFDYSISTVAGKRNFV